MNRDYKEKIIYHMNKLDEALTTSNARNIQKYLDSVTYFTNKQLDIVKHRFPCSAELTYISRDRVVECSLDLDYEFQQQSE